MTEEQFIKRCKLIYNKGFMRDRDVSISIREATDCFSRLRYVYAKHPEYFSLIKNDYQGNIAMDDLGKNLDERYLLASDNTYKAVEFACILDHPCQECAEDKDALHTRYGFCGHKEHD